MKHVPFSLILLAALTLASCREKRSVSSIVTAEMGLSDVYEVHSDANLSPLLTQHVYQQAELVSEIAERYSESAPKLVAEIQTGTNKERRIAASFLLDNAIRAKFNPTANLEKFKQFGAIAKALPASDELTSYCIFFASNEGVPQTDLDTFWEELINKDSGNISAVTTACDPPFFKTSAIPEFLCKHIDLYPELEQRLSLHLIGKRAPKSCLKMLTEFAEKHKKGSPKLVAACDEALRSMNRRLR